MDQPRTPLPAEALSHLDALYNLARWLVRDPADAEDQVQDRMPHTGGVVNVDDRLTGPLDGTAGLDLTTALNRLPEEYRSVVLLADLEDFSMGEIAAIMDCPVGTVKSRLFRARGILKQILRDYVQ